MLIPIRTSNSHEISLEGLTHEVITPLNQRVETDDTRANCASRLVAKARAPATVYGARRQARGADLGRYTTSAACRLDGSGPSPSVNHRCGSLRRNADQHDRGLGQRRSSRTGISDDTQNFICIQVKPDVLVPAKTAVVRACIVERDTVQRQDGGPRGCSPRGTMFSI